MSKKKSFLIPTIIFVVLVFSNVTSAEPPSGRITVRDDGLSLALVSISDKEIKAAPYQYVSLLIKTGSAYDPAQKSGLTQLTNELIYLFFRDTSALNVDFFTAPDFSVFQFTVAGSDFEKFTDELDSIIRLDALMLYDACNEMIRIHQSEPVVPSLSANLKMAELIYGPDHPYTRVFKPDFKNLTINDVNAWFRKIYRPNNMIISSSRALPDDFLRRPTGRDLKSPTGLAKLPQPIRTTSPKVAFAPIHDSVSTVRIGFPAPALNDGDFFGAILSEKFLEKELWDRLREDAGLCYDLHLEYTYLTNAAAPDLEIVFQTLPADTAVAVKKVLQIIKEYGTKGIPADRLTEIITRETKRREARDGSINNLVVSLGFQALYEQTWLMDSAGYITRLNQVPPTAPPSFITRKLSQIKIAIAGPAEVAGLIPSITSEANAIGKK